MNVALRIITISNNTTIDSAECDAPNDAVVVVAAADGPLVRPSCCLIQYGHYFYYDCRSYFLYFVEQKIHKAREIDLPTTKED